MGMTYKFPYEEASYIAVPAVLDKIVYTMTKHAPITLQSVTPVISFAMHIRIRSGLNGSDICDDVAPNG